eukprot:Rmarinus@m.29884
MASHWWENDVERVLLTEEQIRNRVKELGEELAKEYVDKNPIFLGVMIGSYIFVADLSRACQFRHEVHFISASSYGKSTVSSGNVNLEISALKTSLEGRHVVVTEDIVDTGHTLKRIVSELKKLNPASIKVCTLCDKPSRRVITDEAVDFCGFHVPDEFVVGYGLDYDERYRHLPVVAVLKREIYAS